MFKVVLSHALCEEGMALLRRQMDVDTVVANTVDESELLPLLKDADAFILRMGKMNKRMLQLCPRMKVIARPGVGVDTIDVDYAAEHGIPVVVTPGANSRSVAEHTMALLLALSKNLPESLEKAKMGQYDVRNKYAAFELYGKTLGVMGFGHIGKITAQIASAFGMRIAVYDPYVPSETICALGYHACSSVEEILPICDMITLHMQSNAQTRGMIGERELSTMRRGALLVNCARGDLVCEDALYNALRDGHLGGAAEDMMSSEPFDLSSPLLTLPNFLASPHMAALTREASARAAVMAVEGTLAVLHGEKWPHVYRKDVYDHRQWKDLEDKEEGKIC